MGWGLEKGSVDRGDAIENAKLVGKINSFRKSGGRNLGCEVDR